MTAPKVPPKGPGGLPPPDARSDTNTVDSSVLVLSKEGVRGPTFAKTCDRIVVGLDKKTTPREREAALDLWRAKVFPPPMESTPPPGLAFLTNFLKSDPTLSSYGRSVAYLIAVSTVVSDETLQKMTQELIDACKKDPQLNAGVAELRTVLRLQSEHPGPSAQPALRLLKAIEALTNMSSDQIDKQKAPPAPAAPVPDKAAPAIDASAKGKAPALLGAVQQSARQGRLEPALQKQLVELGDGDRQALAAALISSGLETQSLFAVAPLELRLAVVQQLAARGLFVYASLPNLGATVTGCDQALSAAARLVGTPLGFDDATLTALGGDQLDARKPACQKLQAAVDDRRAQLAVVRKSLAEAKAALVTAIARLSGDDKLQAQAALDELERMLGKVMTEDAALGPGSPAAELLGNLDKTNALLATWPDPGSPPELQATKLAELTVALETLTRQAASDLAKLPQEHPLRSVLEAHTFGQLTAGRKAMAASALVALKLTLPVLEKFGGEPANLALLGEVESGRDKFYGAPNKPGQLQTLDDAAATQAVAHLRSQRGGLIIRGRAIDAEIRTTDEALQVLVAAAKERPLTADEQLRAHRYRAMLGDPRSGLGLRAQKAALAVAVKDLQQRADLLETRWPRLEKQIQDTYAVLGQPRPMSFGSRDELIKKAVQLAQLVGVPAPVVSGSATFGAIESALVLVENQARAKQRITHHMVLVPRLRALGLDWPDPPKQFLSLLGQGALPKDPAAQRKLMGEYNEWLQKDYASALTVLAKHMGLAVTPPDLLDADSLRSLFGVRGLDGQARTGQQVETNSPYIDAEQKLAVEMQTLAQADLKSLQAYFGKQLSAGLVGIPFDDLRKLAANPDTEPALRRAAQKLVQNPNAFIALCTATGAWVKPGDPRPINAVLSMERLNLWVTRAGNYPAQLSDDGKPIADTAGRVMLSMLRPGTEGRCNLLDQYKPDWGQQSYEKWFQTLSGLSAEEKQALAIEYDRSHGKVGAFFAAIADFPGATRGSILHLYHTNETVETYTDAILGFRSTAVITPASDDAKAPTVGDSVDQPLEAIGTQSSPEVLGKRFDKIMSITDEQNKLVDSGIFSLVNKSDIDKYHGMVSAAREAVKAYHDAVAKQPRDASDIAKTSRDAARALAVARLYFNDLRWSKVEGDKSVTRGMRTIAVPVAVTGVAIVATIAALPSGGTSVAVGGLAIAALIGTAAGTAVAFAGSYGTQAMRGADANYDDAWSDSKAGAITAATGAIGVVLPIGAAAWVERAAALGVAGAELSVGMRVVAAYPKAAKLLTLPVANLVSTGTGEALQVGGRALGALPDAPHTGPGLGFNLGRAGVSGLMFSVLGGPFSKLSPAASALANVGSGVAEEALVQYAVMPYLYPELAGRPETKEQAIVAIFQTGLMGLVSDRMFAMKHARAAGVEVREKAVLGVNGDDVMIPRPKGDGFVVGLRIRQVHEDGTVVLFDTKQPQQTYTVPARVLLDVNPHIASRRAAPPSEGGPLPSFDVAERLFDGRLVTVGGEAQSLVGLSPDGHMIVVRNAKGQPRLVPTRDLLTQNPAILRGVAVPFEVLGSSHKAWHIEDISHGKVKLSAGDDHTEIPLTQLLDRAEAALVRQGVPEPVVLQSGGVPDKMLSADVAVVVDAYAKTNRLPAEQRIPDGFRDGGSGEPREVLVVDAKRDPALRQMLDEVAAFQRLPEDERVMALQNYVEQRFSGATSAGELAKAYSGRELLIGEGAVLGVGGSRVRALAFKVLGEHVGLGTALIRGTPPGGKLKGAWNDVRMSDGSTVRVDWTKPQVAAQAVGASTRGAVGADTLPGIRTPPLCNDRVVKWNGGEARLAGLDIDGRVRIARKQGNHEVIESVELSDLAKANPGLFDGTSFTLPPRGGGVAEPGWTINVSDGRVFAMRPVGPNAHQVTELTARAFVTQCRSELVGVPPSRLPPVNPPPHKAAPVVNRPFAERLRQPATPSEKQVADAAFQHLSGSDRLSAMGFYDKLFSPKPGEAIDPAKLQTLLDFIACGETGIEVLAGAVNSRQKALELPANNPVRANAEAELAAIAKVQLRSNAQIASRFASLLAQPGADRALLLRLVDLHPSVQVAVVTEFSAAGASRQHLIGEEVRKHWDALSGVDPAKRTAALLQIDQVVIAFDKMGDVAVARQLVEQLAQARAEGTKESAVRVAALEKLLEPGIDKTVAQHAFELLKNTTSPGEQAYLWQILKHGNAYEGIFAYEKLDFVRSQALAKGQDVSRFDAARTQLMEGVFLDRHENIPSGTLMTPQQAGRAAETLLGLSPEAYAQVSGWLRAARTPYEAALLLKSIAANQEVLLGADAASRSQAIGQLDEFANSIRGYDRPTLERMTTLLGVDYDPSQGGWVVKGGFSQALTTSCGPTAALIGAAQVDPSLAWRFRMNPTEFEGAQARLMDREGARFVRVRQDALERGIVAIYDRAFEGMEMVRQSNAHMITPDELERYTFWQGRKSSSEGKYGEAINDPLLRAMYDKLAPLLKAKQINSFNNFVSALTLNQVQINAKGGVVQHEGTVPINYANDVIGGRAGVGYDSRLIARPSELGNQLPAMEKALRTTGPVPLNVAWEPRAEIGHALIVTDVFYKNGVRYWTLVDPAGIDGQHARSAFVTDAMLLSSDVVAQIHAGQKARVSEVLLPKPELKRPVALPGTVASRVSAGAVGSKASVGSPGAAEVVPRSTGPVTYKPATRTSPLLVSPLLGALEFGGNIAYKARVASAVLAASKAGGEVIVGGLSLQGFKQWNSPHELGDAVIRAYAGELRRLEADFQPHLQIFHNGGKDFSFVYTGPNPEKLAAALQSRLAGKEQGAVQQAMWDSLRSPSGGFPAASGAPQDLQFYGGMARVKIGKGEDPLAATQRVTITSAQAAKEAQLTLPVNGHEPTTIGEAVTARASKFVIFDEAKVRALIARDGPTRNEFFPFGTEVTPEMIELARVGSTDKLTPEQRYKLILCQGGDTPVGKAAADELKRLAIADVMRGKLKEPRVKVAVEGADEIVVVGARPGPPAQAYLAYIDLNAFGAINKIHNYPETGPLMPAVRELRSKRHQPIEGPATGAELGDVLKAQMLGRIKKAVEKGEDPQVALDALAAQFRTEFRADPNLAVTDKVQPTSYDDNGRAAAFAAGQGAFTADFAGRQVKVTVTSKPNPDGSVPVVVSDGATQRATVARYDGEKLTLDIADARPGLSTGIVPLLVSQLGGTEAVPTLKVIDQPTTGNNLAGLWTVRADQLSIEAKQRLKIGLLLGDADLPTTRTGAIDGDPASFKQNVARIYNRTGEAILERSLRDTLTQRWQGSEP